MIRPSRMLPSVATLATTTCGSCTLERRRSGRHRRLDLLAIDTNELEIESSARLSSSVSRQLIRFGHQNRVPDIPQIAEVGTISGHGFGCRTGSAGRETLDEEPRREDLDLELVGVDREQI